MTTKSKIPMGKRIIMKQMFQTIGDTRKGNRYIAMQLGLHTTAVTNYRHGHGRGMGHYKNPPDIPFEKLTPRAKRLVIKFGGKNFKL